LEAELIYKTEENVEVDIQYDDTDDDIIRTEEMYKIIPKIIFIKSKNEQYIGSFLTDEEKDILASIKANISISHNYDNLIRIKINTLSIYDIKQVIDELLLGTKGYSDIFKLLIFTTSTGLKILYYKMYI
jgi:hypothetical protein